MYYLGIYLVEITLNERMLLRLLIVDKESDFPHCFAHIVTSALTVISDTSAS